MEERQLSLPPYFSALFLSFLTIVKKIPKYYSTYRKPF
jgi:hypothetical protein